MTGVEPLTMPADEAADRYREYREGLAGRAPTDDDRGIMLGYAALAKGRGVLDLMQVFRACPLDAKGLPRLAAARAHWLWCHFDRYGDGTPCFGNTRWTVRNDRRPWHAFIQLERGMLTRPAGLPNSWTDHRALCPIIPPNLRPARALYRYVVLFEAEWQPVPPTDPMLLRHLHGNLYAVLACWDLTPIERAVLAGRLSEG